MHKPTIHPDVVRRAHERRGRLRVFDSLIPERTAHIVVDLQNGFMAPGQVAEIATAREIVPNVNRISAALRAAGGLVVYIQNTFDPVAVATWSTFFEHFCTPERRQRMIETFSPGRVRPCDLARARRAAAGPSRAETPLRRVRARLVRPARDPAGTRHRHADRHRHRDAGVLRVRPRAMR